MLFLVNFLTKYSSKRWAQLGGVWVMSVSLSYLDLPNSLLLFHIPAAEPNAVVTRAFAGHTCHIPHLQSHAPYGSCLLGVGKTLPLKSDISFSDVPGS